MTLDDSLPKLRARLDKVAPIPPHPRFSDFDLAAKRPEAGSLKPAAVLVPLVERAGRLHVILTRRALSLSNHPGQVAFPGGRCDAGDADVAATALREAREEIGLDQAHVTVLGMGDGYETVSGYAVTPIVGLVAPHAALTPDPREVADIFELPLSVLMDPTHYVPQTRQYKGVDRHFYVIRHGDHYVWGATAGMLRALYLRVFAG
jgi:8-oxo-dGTP pyrophosphatase MutT (NUDIX family)